MAKVNSIFKIKGTLGQLTFYEDQYGTPRVRQKSSLDRERVLNDPAFVRTRENSREFGSANTAGTLLRRGAAPFLKIARDPGLAPRMLGLMCKVKDQDQESARGERTVGKGLLTAEGRQLLKGFDFNKDAPLDSVLRCPYALEPGFVFRIPSLAPRRMLQAPKAATHASFRCCAVLVDFAAGTTITTYSPEVLVPLHLPTLDVTVAPDAVPTGNGILFWLLLVEFSQELNGLQYPLHERKYNVLHLLDAVPATPKKVSCKQPESKTTLPLLATFESKPVGKNAALFPSQELIGAKAIGNQKTAFEIHPPIRGVPIELAYVGCMLSKEPNIASFSYKRPAVAEKKAELCIGSVWESLSGKNKEQKIDDS